MKRTDEIVFKEAQTITFWGASDDLIELSSPQVNEEYNVNVDTYAGYFVLSAGDNQFAKVHVIYDGCWCFAYGLFDEDYTLPKWNPRTELNPQEFNAYSATLSLDIPAFTMLVFRPAREY